MCRSNLNNKHLRRCSKGIGRLPAAIKDCVTDLLLIKDPKEQKALLKAMVSKFVQECPNHQKIKFRKKEKKGGRNKDGPAKKKECCAKHLTPLIGTRLKEDQYYIVYVADMTRLPKSINDGYNRYIDHTVAVVAGSPDACDCDGSGTNKLNPVYFTYKGLGGLSFDIRYVLDAAEANALHASGYTKPIIYFYCAKTKGQCGAHEPIRRYFFPGRQHFFTTSVEEGSKKVAAGWKDEGIVCYGWPSVHMGPENTFSWLS